MLFAAVSALTLLSAVSAQQVSYLPLDIIFVPLIETWNRLCRLALQPQRQAEFSNSFQIISMPRTELQLHSISRECKQFSVEWCYCTNIIDSSFSPGNHSVTQSTFTDPCDPAAGGFDSGWVLIASPSDLTETPQFNLTITNDQKRESRFCQLLVDLISELNYSHLVLLQATAAKSSL